VKMSLENSEKKGKRRVTRGCVAENQGERDKEGGGGKEEMH